MKDEDFVTKYRKMMGEKPEDDFKEFAMMLHAIYVSLRESGFTANQSIELIKTIILKNINDGLKRD